MFRSIKNWILRYVFRQPIHGLYDEVDERNFGASVIAGQVTRDDLSGGEFQTCDIDLIDQKNTDFCAGCSKAYGKQATEHRRMSWAGAFAMGCRALGYVTTWGISILQIMKGGVKYGVPEERLWPYTGNRNYCANWKNMTNEVLRNAELHKDESFFMIDYQIGWDRFDLFRAYLNKLKDKKIIIQTGVDAHAVTLNAQIIVDGEIKLKGPDSYGRWNHNYRIGKCIEGYRYFSRAEANQLFNGYISFDMKRDLAELLNTYNGKAVKLKNHNDCYLVQGGQLRLLKNEAIAWAHNTLLFGENYVFVLTLEEMGLIPIGKPASFGDGPNHEIVRRILEKTGHADLIDEN